MLQRHTHSRQCLSLLSLDNVHIGTIEVVTSLCTGEGEKGTIVTFCTLVISFGEEAPGHQTSYLSLAVGCRELVFIEIRKSLIVGFHLHIDPCNL